MILRKLKIFLASLCLLFGVSLATAAPAYATTFKCDAYQGIDQLDGSSGCSSTEGQSTVSHLVTVVVDILSYIVGVVAVIMLIIGGLKYITSGGEASSVSGAKNTIIYALIGLVVVAIAQFLVYFVVKNVT